MRVEDDVVTVRPIAGTRPRGATPEEDRAYALDLQADEKELAEHRMLVDLAGMTSAASPSMGRSQCPIS